MGIEGGQHSGGQLRLGDRVTEEPVPMSFAEGRETADDESIGGGSSTSSVSPQNAD